MIFWKKEIILFYQFCKTGIVSFFLRVRHIFYGDPPLILNKGYWFWTQTFLWKVSSASRSLIVARCRHGHFEWLAFDTHQRLFNFKINFIIKFVSSASRLLFIFIVRQVLHGDSLLIQNKKYCFWNQFFFGKYQVLQCHLLWLEVSTVTLSG